MTIKEKQNIFDITAQNFGRLDDVIRVSNDNDLSISELLTANTEITINNNGIGNEEIKKEVIEKSLTFNNDAV